MLAGILGAFRAGLVAVPVSTMLTAAELGKIAGRLGCPDAGAARPEFADAVGGRGRARRPTSSTWSSPATDRLTGAGRRSTVHVLGGPGRAAGGDPADGRARRHRRGLVGAVALHLAARPACPRRRCTGTPTSGTSARPTASQVLGITPDDRDVLGGQAVLRLRHRQLAVLPALGRGHDRPGAAAADPGRRARSGSARTGRRCSSRCPTFYAALLVAATCPRGRSPSVRLAASAGEALPGRAAARGSPTGSGWTSSTASAPPRRCTSSCPTGPGDIRPGHDGHAGPGLRRRDPRTTTGEPVAAGAARRAARARGVDRPRLLVPDRGLPAGVPGRVAGHRRHLRPRRRTATTPAWAATSDMIKAGGIWVSPAEVESRLLEHPAVREAAVVGVRRRATGSTSRWPCRGRPDGVGARTSWSPGAATGLAHFKAPRQVVFVDDLPKTATGQAAAVQGPPPAGQQPDELRGSNHVPYVIASACIDVNDKSCVEECPVDCIYEGDRKSYINPKECIDCGACEPVCPVEAITQDRRVADGDEPFVEDNRRVLRRGAGGPRRAAGRARRGRARSVSSGPTPRWSPRAGRLSRARRPPARRRPRARPRARVAEAGLGRVGARLRPGRHPRGRLGRRRRASTRRARRALRGAGRRRGAAVLRVQPQGHRLSSAFDDLLPIVEHNPARFRPVANVNPHLHFPIADGARAPARPRRGGAQAAPGARRLPLRRHGALRRRTQVLDERGVPLVVHCGTSIFPGSIERVRRPGATCCRWSATSRPSTWSSPTAAGAGGTTRRRSWR